jgi:hypothetical protein
LSGEIGPIGRYATDFIGGQPADEVGHDASVQ